MGGASTQIAFVPEGNILANKYPVNIGSETYDIYVHSYLIYGQQEVDRWTRTKIYESSSPTGIRQRRVSDPCLLKGKTFDPLLHFNVVRGFCVPIVNGRR